MESRFLTVAEAARYIRLNPRSVYLLAQRGAIPASRVTGKWLFPVHLLDEWLEASVRQRTGVRPARGRASLPPGNLFLAGSDDPALELLPDALHGEPAQPLLFTATLGSVGGLEALAGGRADVACAHLVDRASGEYNLPHLPRYLPGRVAPRSAVARLPRATRPEGGPGTATCPSPGLPESRPAGRASRRSAGSIGCSAPLRPP